MNARNGSMDELGLENPKASGAETLSAFSVFSEEAYVGLYTTYFVILELVCFALYILVPEPEVDIEHVSSAFSDTRNLAMLGGFYLALLRLSALFRRSCRLNRIRLSIWERELELYRAKRRTVATAIIASCLAAAIWLPLIVKRFF